MPLKRENLDIKIDQLKPYKNNPRTHTKGQIAQIQESIREFGFTNPLLIDEDNGVIAGHGRLEAAKGIGMASVPAVRISGLTSAQKRALVIADNRIALNAGWDDGLLKAEIGALLSEGFDVNLLGFGDNEMGRLLGPAGGKTEEDTVMAPVEDPITVLGDVWLMGGHRLICGDSTSATDVARVLNGIKPNLMVTDPPYGVKYDPSYRSDNKRKQGTVLNDDRADWSDAWALFPGDVAYVWHASMFTDVVIHSLEKCGFKRRSNIQWVKDRFAMGRADYHWQHEPCWYVVREKKTGNWCGDRKQTTVWEIKAREDGGYGHSTQKPVECMRKPMQNNSNEGQVVYDPFLGSGSSIIAAETIGRSCYGLELSPQYCDMIVQRWQNFTGKDAIHESTGKKYNEMKNVKKKTRAA